MIADIFVTIKGGRPILTSQMLESLIKSTPKEQYRLTVVLDGVNATSVPADLEGIHLIANSKNQGLGPSINAALAHINSLRQWDEIPPPVTCYVQDDVVFQEGWLHKLTTKFLQLEKPLNLAFASGHAAEEHKKDPRAETKELGNGMYTNKYIRATNMLARHETWMSMWPIPKIDPETGQERGRPHDGLGSGVDWHFVRVHPNSVVKSRKTNLVIPGLVVHAGYKESTWLKRDLPESESDRERIHG